MIKGSIDFIETTSEFMKTLTPAQKEQFTSIIRYLNYNKILRDTKIYKKVKGKFIASSQATTL